MSSQCVLDLLMEYGTIYLVQYVQQSRRFQDLKIWSQVRQGTVLLSKCDYILGIDRRHVELVGIQDMRNCMSDHFALRARLLRCPAHCHAQYLRGSRTLPLRHSPTTELNMVDAKFHTLNILEPVPPKLKRPPQPLWMSP